MEPHIIIWQMIGATAAVSVPVMGVFWYLIRTEIRNQLFGLQILIDERIARVESRVTTIESAGSANAKEALMTGHSNAARLVGIEEILRLLPCRKG
jgi:hypothetical protein